MGRCHGEIQTAVMRRLENVFGYGNIRLFKRNTGGMHIKGKGGKKRFIRFNEPGQADLDGFVLLAPEIPMYFCVEIKKAGDKKLRPSQLFMQRELEERGVIYHVIYGHSFEPDLSLLIKRIRDREKLLDVYKKDL